MVFKPVGYGKNEESIIFYVKHYNIRLKVECNFDSGLAIIKFANGNFNNSRDFPLVKEKLYNHHDFILQEADDKLYKKWLTLNQ